MKYDTSKLDQNLVAQASKGGQWDENDQGRYDALVKAQQQSSQPNSASKSNPKAQSNLTKQSNSTPARQQAKKKAQTVISKSKGTNTSIRNNQSQRVNQDNDIDTNVNGNNNKVFNQQDNSIRQYGGDNRSLVINEGSGGKGSNKYYTSADKAITMGTLSGFYDVDDSPAAQAGYVDQQQTMNRDAQKKYANSGTRIASKYAGFRGGDLNMKTLQQRIDSNGQHFSDLATIQEVKTYGDRAAKRDYAKFEFGDPIEEVTSNAGEIASGYKDDIDDM